MAFLFPSLYSSSQYERIFKGSTYLVLVQANVYFFAICTLLTGCVGQRTIYPLAPWERTFGIQAGGPFIALNKSTVPVPFSAIYFAQGLKKASSIQFGLHPTAILFGTLYADAGIQKSFVFSNGLLPGINASLLLNTMATASLSRFRFYPQSDIACWWSDKGRNRLLYIGVTHWFDPYFHQVQFTPSYQLWRPAFWIGVQHRRKQWDFTMEVKWLAPGEINRFSAVKYIGVSDQGAVGIYFSTQYRF